jgi:hypothetical protein
MESAMNRWPTLSPQIPFGEGNFPPVVPLRVEMIPVDLITIRTTPALLSEINTSPFVATHTPNGNCIVAAEA